MKQKLKNISAKAFFILSLSHIQCLSNDILIGNIFTVQHKIIVFAYIDCTVISLCTKESQCR